jgi:hypothetical protein
VLDGVFDLAALEDLAVGQHADAHSTLLTPRRRSAEGGESGASCPTSSKQKHRTQSKWARTVFADLMKERLLRDEQAQLVEVLLEAARRFADIEPQ